MYNRCFFVGRIGTIKPAEKVCNASICTTESYKDKESGDWVNIDQWTNLTIFGASGDRFKNGIAVGDLVMVEGKLRTDKFEDKFYTKVIVSYFRKLKGGKASEEGDSAKQDSSDKSNNTPPSEPAPAMAGTGEGDDLPF